VDDFYAARSRTIPPLPWSNIAPPFSLVPTSARLTAGRMREITRRPDYIRAARSTRMSLLTR